MGEQTLQPALSPQGTLNKADYKSLFATAALFAVSAGVADLSTNLNVLHLSQTEVLLFSLVLGMVGKFIQKLMDGPKQ